MTNTELRATFIVRLWRDRDAPTGEWRGEVDHVQPSHKVRFADQAALLAYICSQLAQVELEPPAPASTTSDHQPDPRPSGVPGPQGLPEEFP